MPSRDEVMIAFSKVPRPGGEALTPCGCEECRWQVSRFRATTWPRLSLDDLAAGNDGANLPILTPPAFHYFLPGLLLLAIDYPEVQGEILSKIIRRFAVSDSEGEAARSRVDQVVKRLSGRQRQILVDFLRQGEDMSINVPAIWNAAIQTLTDGVTIAFSQVVVDRWLDEKRRKAR